MTAIAFFNNKGGVGKTTLVCNIAFQLAETKNVLVVDCDPQCNSTQLILSDETSKNLYLDVDNPPYPTLLDVVRPISDGDAYINLDVEPASRHDNRFNVDILPGHPRMSIVEDQFSQAWQNTKGGDIGGIRRTNWAATLNRSLAERYDLVFYDLGPSLGSLNRTVLLGCDQFVTPMGPDIFSIVGIRNIAEWLDESIRTYTRGLGNSDPEDRERHGISDDLPISQGFAGYTVQQYITKSKGGERRPTGAFEEILKTIPDEIEHTLQRYAAVDFGPERAKLGDVPNMFSIIPMAQTANAPIGTLRYADGLRGSQFQQQSNYAEMVGSVAQRLAENLA